MLRVPSICLYIYVFTVNTHSSMLKKDKFNRSTLLVHLTIAKNISTFQNSLVIRLKVTVKNTFWRIFLKFSEYTHMNLLFYVPEICLHRK